MSKTVINVELILDRVNIKNKRISVDVILEDKNTLEVESVRTILDDKGGIWPARMKPYHSYIFRKVRTKAVTVGINFSPNEKGVSPK